MNDIRQYRTSPAPSGVGPRAAVVAVALSLSLLPWFLAADRRPSALRETNQKHISGLTVAERKRLEENLQTYREMPVAERDRLREMQQTIDNDPDLKAAFGDYQAWANFLSPVDRHELRQTRDPEARQRLLEKFRRPMPLDERPDFLPSGRPPNGPGLAQNNNVRQRVLDRLFDGIAMPLADRAGTNVPEMEAIIRILEHELPAETHEELGKLDEYSRKVRVLRLTMERHPFGPPNSRVFGTGRDVIDKVIAALPDGPVKQFQSNRSFDSNSKSNLPDPRGAMLVMVLIRGLATETLRTIEDHRPRNDLLDARYQMLSEAERKRIDNLSFKDREQELKLLYLQEHISGIAELQQILGNPDVRRFMENMPNRMRPAGGPIDGDDRRDKKGRSVPFEGKGRPNDFDSPPPNRPESKD